MDKSYQLDIILYKFVLLQNRSHQNITRFGHHTVKQFQLLYYETILVHFIIKLKSC